MHIPYVKKACFLLLLTLYLKKTIIKLLKKYFNRFRYPERPIIFYSASYFAVSSLHVAAFFINLNASCNERVG